MKKILIASTIAVTFASAAMAGGPGPVIVADAPVIVADTGSSSSAGMGSLGTTGYIIGGLLLVGVIAAAVSDNNNNDSSSSTVVDSNN